MNLVPRNLYPLTAFTVVYMIFSGINAWATGNSEFVFYLLLMVIIGSLTLYIHERIRLPHTILWSLSLWGLLHMMGGMLILPSTGDVLYNLWLIPEFLRYDQLIHAFGFAVATWACWFCLKAIQPNLRPSAGPLALTLFAGLGLGAMNETVEFFATLLFPETNVGDYTNVGWDLVFNLIGCLVAVLALRFSAWTSVQSQTQTAPNAPRSKLL